MSDAVKRRDNLIEAAITGRQPEPDALCIVARYVPLRALERVAVLVHAPTVAELLSLDHYALERLIGRPLRRTRWEPRHIHAEIAVDRRWSALPERRILWIGEKEYPAHLRNVWDPPAVLFGWGDPTILLHRGIAVVGTRKPDDTGLSAAYRLGRELGERGVVVVSGLALGIDSSAHRGAMQSGTPAIAVLGSGIDTVYPRENRGLAADLLDTGGLIVSEYPPGTKPHRRQFPARNRIVVGLSAAVVVVQAPERSGALISADFGLQNGVEVLVHQAGMEWTGCRALVSAGAGVVTGPDSILEYVSPEPVATVTDSEPEQRNSEKRKLALFDSDPGVSF